MRSKRGLSKVLSLGLAIIGVAVAAPVGAGLLGYYTFEGNADDVSGNGRHGTLSATAPTVTAAGYQGSAYQFGAGGADTFVDVPIDINPSVLPQVTFGAWVNADVANAVIRGVISHDDGGFDRTLDIDTRNSAQAAQWCGFTGSGVFCGADVAVDEWVFLAARYDATSGDGALSVNGLHLNWSIGGGPGAGLATTTIGRNPRFDAPFAGRIDNVFFYDEFLSDQQLDTIRTNGITIKVPEPATIVLMGLGLAAIGCRRRRSLSAE